MTTVHDVEAAVGEDHRFAVGLPGADAVRQFLRRVARFRIGLAVTNGVPQTEEFAAMDRVRTDFRYDDAGCPIGHMQCRPNGEPCSRRSNHHGYDGVAGAAHIEDVLLGRRVVPYATVCSHNGNTFRGSRHHNVVKGNGF